MMYALAISSVATQLVGLPQALILQNLNNEIRFIVPTPPPVRPKIKTVPFTTDIVLDRHSRSSSYETPIHDLRSAFVRDDDIDRYRCPDSLSRIVSNLSSRVRAYVPLLRSLRTDVPFSADSVRMLDLIMGIEDTHPNAISVIFSIHQLACSNGYTCKDIEVGGPMGEEQHVSAVCRPAQSTTLDFVSMDARDKRVQVNCPRKHMRGGRKLDFTATFPAQKTKVTTRKYCLSWRWFCLHFDHHKRVWMGTAQRPVAKGANENNGRSAR